MDRNQGIGFALLLALAIGYFTLTRNDKGQFEEQQKIEQAKKIAEQKKADSLKSQLPEIIAQSKAQAGTWAQYLNGNSENTIIENSKLIINFSNKGGQPFNVQLKGHKKNEHLVNIQHDYSALNYKLKGNGADIDVKNLIFTKINQTPNSIEYSLKDSIGNSLLKHKYTIDTSTYLVQLNIEASPNTIGDKILLEWNPNLELQELDKTYELEQSNIGFQENGSYNFETIGNGDTKTFNKPLDYLVAKQQFFCTGIISSNKLAETKMAWKPDNDSASKLFSVASSFNISGNNIAGVTSYPMQLIYAPIDYSELKKYNLGIEQAVPYGSGIFAFVKYINRYFLLPVFNFFKSLGLKMGIVIMLLTILIRLLTGPIFYKSYLSGAKMKALKPEIDALKAKHGDDNQAFSVAQMALWKQAGVSPLGGCLPALFQLPIFMSLFYFFQANIFLRGESFLWAKDLAAWDSIASIPNIPFYGDHISLFTITATVTSLLISLYGMSNMQQDNSNPVLKYMPYIFPVFLLFIFNKLPAALTWYYTVSNVIALIIQFVINRFIINHDKIKLEIEENKKKKPKPATGFMAKMAEMQEQTRKMQEEKKKQKKK